VERSAKHPRHSDLSSCMDGSLLRGKTTHKKVLVSARYIGREEYGILETCQYALKADKEALHGAEAARSL
jgi:hypothetical protein